MLSATVEFLLGTYRADPHGTAQTGRLERGEWPPAPSRLFDALVAADGTGQRRRHTDGTELEMLEAAPSPSIEACVDVHHQELNPRYVAAAGGSFAFKKTKNRPLEVRTHQEFVGRVGNKVQPGVRVTPRVPVVRYLWPINVKDQHLRALQLRAARVGYLGCADSPVRVRVERLPDDASVEAATYEPDPDGALAIGVPTAGRLQALDAAFTQWIEHGPSVGRSQYPALATKAKYRAPSESRAPSATARVAATLVLRPSVAARRVSALTATFKAAVLKQYQALHGEPFRELHGHGFAAPGYDSARYLALPDVGHPYASGRIHGLALWLPDTVSDDLAAATRSAVARVKRLRGMGVDVGAEMWVDQRRPVSPRPSRWSGPARHWVSVFPVIHERHRQVTLAEVSRWCANAGLPAPVAVRNSRSALIAGAARLASVEVHRQGRPKRPFSHVELWFDEPVTGPVVIGSGRQRGFGLCLPIIPRSPVQPGRRRD